MKIFRRKIIIVALLAILVAGSYYIYSMNNEAAPSSVWETGIPGSAPFIAQALTPDNATLFEFKKFNFSFLYPTNLKESVIENPEGGIVLVFQDVEKVEGFQIIITPFDEEGSVLDEERIRRDVPDLKLENPELLQLGESGRGVAFLSDNDNFGKNSREVWFIYKGNLYQISTYRRLDPLLQSVLTTWEFK